VVIFHLIQRHFSDILGCVAVYDVYYYMKASGFLMTQRQITLN